MNQTNQAWGSRIGLILAMAGNAVGFGNFLRFPVQAIQNGGGAFIIPYLVSFLILGLPLLFIEWSIGRYGGSRGFHSTPLMMQSMDRRRMWKYVGVFGLFCNIGIASYYCYLESWTLAYIFHSATGTFNGMNQHQVVQLFSDYVSIGKTTLIPFEPIVFFLICLGINVYILSKGLSGGVEKVAKIGMPLLILFGIILAIRAVTLKSGVDGAVYDSSVGLNFLWTPHFDSIYNPKVWFAAASQIFFTLSLGMGSIHAYSSYLKRKDDIALNAMSAGWMNEFVEVVLGGAIIIPIAVGYLGIDRVKELAAMGGLGLGFKTIPYLFSQWGHVIGAVAGVMWFGLLFFAGITSSLAMGTPVQGFLEDEFKWSRRKTALAFGGIILILGLPTILFFNQGVFDEYDYWTGSFALFVFAAFEAVLFAWFFGIKKGWEEINTGADIRVSRIFRFLIMWVTPVLLIIVFLGAVFTPVGNDWAAAFHGLFQGQGWIFDHGSVVGKLMNSGLKEQLASATDPGLIADIKYRILLTNLSRLLLVALFVGISLIVRKAYYKHKREGTI
ncbi:MAG TPA: sodium-dependent transporter [Bacteroidales bacterium]|nr:sodium-dependent transporter [Bacteroidales bacterium]HOE05028.1 sodium-dependent transporter [Bacteroidales bacterium]